MGKRKRPARNIVKVDLGDFIFTKSEPLPVFVQHSSKDGRRIEQTVHQIPAPQSNPPPLGFDPCPVTVEDDDEDDEDDVFPGVEPPGGEDDGDRVRSRFSPLFGVPDGSVGYSGIHFGYGPQTVTSFFKNLSCWKGAWNSAMGCAIFV